MHSSSASPYLLMLLGSLSFAWMGFLAHAAGANCDWRIVALARALLVLILVGLYTHARGVRFVFLRPRILWVRSISGSCSLICTFYALTHLPVSTVLTLTNIFPIWVALLSWPMLGRLPSMRVWLSVACAVAGVALIQQPELKGDPVAMWCALAASVFTAIAMLGLHRLHGIAAAAVVVHFSAVGVLFCIGAFLVIPPSSADLPRMQITTVSALLGVGLTASVGQLLLTRAFAHGDPAKVSVVGLSQVVFALGLDLVIWDHRISGMSLLGTALILAPTAWVILKPDAQTDQSAHNPAE